MQPKHIHLLVVLAAASQCLAAAADASPATDSPYGACAHITVNEPPARTCEMMRVAGLRWVRSDICWSVVEKQPGVWDFSRYDQIVSECEAEGLQLLPILYRPPARAMPICNHLDEWAEFVRRFVEHYGKRLPVIEIWNEQNAANHWGDSPSTTNYLAVLRRAYEAAKGVDPTILVAFGGAAGVPLDFIEDIYRQGGADAFDIMNVHPYTQPVRPEGILERMLEKLRALMAKYGDAEKPVWVTEIGYPTHRLVIKGADVLLAGLKVARPGAKTWRALYVTALAPDKTGFNEAVRQTIEGVLPEGSRVETCLAPDVASRLARGDVDAVVYPFNEDYAVDSADAVFEFVKAGGVLVEFGGMPMYNAYTIGLDGTARRADEPHPTRDRDRLRIGTAAWWGDARYPKSVPVHPTAAAQGVTEPPKGFDGARFFTDRLLEPGDEFVPLLSARTNGIDAVAAAVFKFGSDMKGAVVASGLLNTGFVGTYTEEQQAKFCACALGIAFAEGVERLFWFEFRQPDREDGLNNSFYGIVHDNFAPKPALGAYMTFVDARPAGSVQNPGAWRTADGKTYFPQWTRPDGRDAGMIWTTGDPLRREVAFSSPDVEFIDAAGAKVRPPRKGNVCTLTLSDSPLYFIGGELRDEF